MSERKPYGAYIGGGDIAAIIGVNDYMTPLHVWARKTGREPEPEQSVLMRLGLHCENFILADFEESKSVVTTNRQEFYSKHGIYGGHIDGLCVVDGVQCVVDAKLNTTMRSFPDDVLPLHMQAQAQWYMFVTDSQLAMFHVLHCQGGSFKTYSLQRDDETIAWMMDSAASFWACVLSDTPPDVDFSRDEAKDWYRWVKPEPKTSVIVEQSICDDLREIARLSARRIADEKREEELKNKVKIEFNNADEMFGPMGQLIAKSARNAKTGAVNKIAWFSDDLKEGAK